jgi:hypothetical protein
MMWEGISREIEQAKLQIREKQRCEAQLEKCKCDLATEWAVQRECSETLKEYQDHVQKLEGMTLAHLFHSILGDLVDQEGQAAQDELRAKMKLDAANASIFHMEKERSDLKERILQFESAERQYQSLMNRKLNLIREAGGAEGSLGNQLTDLADERFEVLAMQKEVREAFAAAQIALSALNDCDSSLGKAEDWGTWDMLGGGLITTAIKRGHMDDANQAAIYAQNTLRTLARELKDVKMSFATPLTSGGLMSFSDYFFDGLIVDWMVQKEIHNAQDAVGNQLSDVEEVMQNLEQASGELDNRLQRIDKKWAQLVEQAN